MLRSCGSGNKPLEMQTFAPMLRTGDYVAVHDWGTEIGYDDIMAIRHLLEQLFLDACVYHRSLLRFWRVISSA